MLVEKAFAKLAGCYDMLRGGLAYEALMDLTGCPTTCIELKAMPKDALWDLLVREDGNENVMSASVPGVRFVVEKELCLARKLRLRLEHNSFERLSIRYQLVSAASS